ncbi:MAG: SPOCS domain-containing protein [Christensenellales bacterium]
MEIIRENVQLDRYIASVREQAQLEGQVVLQEDQIDILRILAVGARMTAGNAEVLNSAVSMAGKVIFEVLYTPTDNSGVCALEVETDFVHKLALSEAEPGMRARTGGFVRRLDYVLESPRSLALSADVVLEAGVIAPQDIAWVTDIRGVEGVQINSAALTCLSTVEEQIQEVVIQDDVELPQRAPSVDEILQNTAYITVKGADTTLDGAHVEGEMVVHTLYRSAGEEPSLQLVNYTVPLVVDVAWEDAAVPDGEIDATLAVDDIDVVPLTDLSGESGMLRVEAVVLARVSVKEQVLSQGIEDAYAPGRDLEMERVQVSMQNKTLRQNTQQNMRFTLTLPGGLPPVSQAVLLKARPVVTQAQQEDGAVSVSGMLECDVIYTSEEQANPMFGFHSAVPMEFDVALEAAAGQNFADAQIFVRQSQVSALSDDEVECRVSLDVCASVTGMGQASMVVNVTDQGEVPVSADYGIIMVVAQPEDTLWSVARRFNATVDEVTRLNPFLQERDIASGDKVIMYRQLIL